MGPGAMGWQETTEISALRDGEITGPHVHPSSSLSILHSDQPVVIRFNIDEITVE